MNRRQSPAQLRLVPRSPVASRTCSRCRLTLPLTEFDRRGAEHRRWCRTCLLEAASRPPGRIAA